LTTLPSEIGQLSNLETLNLSDNSLRSVPTEIGLLENLRLLSLDNNQLQHLPSEIGNLHLTCRGCYLNLAENPLISPPPEVVEQGTAAVLEYLRNQAWYHIQRLIVAGASSIGLLAMLILAVRWKQRGGRTAKKKREAES
jgi:internalin A